MADTKLPALTELTAPALDDWTYIVDVSDTTDDATGSSRKLLNSIMLGQAGAAPGGRLTLESGVPISTTSQTLKGTIYYTPYVSDSIRIYNGTSIKQYVFTERSLALTMTSGSNYDVFIYDNAGTLTLELSAAWTNDTTRATALAWQAGVGYVKSGAASRLWLGTIRASGTNQTQIQLGGSDTAAYCGIWNAYNRVYTGFKWFDSTDSWTYTTATWRQKNNSANNQISVINGQVGSAILMGCSTPCANTASNDRYNGIGRDATNAIITGNMTGVAVQGTTQASCCVTNMVDIVGLGFHYYAELEYSTATGTTTWYGDGGAPTYFQSAGFANWAY